MPIRYTIDDKDHVVRMAARGRLTDDEMVDCIATLRADPALAPDMCTLSDMRGIEVGFTRDGILRMRDVMARTDDRRSGARAAIVVDSDAAFGMGRMFEMAADGQQPSFRIFRDMESACEWLGIDVPSDD